MTVAEIVEKRVERVRLPFWVEEAYLKLDFLNDGMHGPWTHLVSPKTQQLLGIEVGSQHVLWWEAFGKEDAWEPYTGTPYFGF